MTRTRVPKCPKRSSQRSLMRTMRFTQVSKPASSSALMASATVERAQPALGDRGIGREAKAAAGVMKAPQQRLKDGQGLGGDRAVSLALLRPAHHGAG